MVSTVGVTVPWGDVESVESVVESVVVGAELLGTGMESKSVGTIRTGSVTVILERVLVGDTDSVLSGVGA